MLLSLQDKLSELERENKTIKVQLQSYASKNAELEHQLLKQQKNQSLHFLQQQQQQQHDSEDMIMFDESEFPAPSGVYQSKYAHPFDVEKRLAERTVTPLNYQKITKKFKNTQNNKKTNKTNTNPKKINNAARAFTAPSSDNNGFSYIYYPSKSRISRKTQRQNLKTLGVANGRVLDIHYPARNVVALLVHNEYRHQLIDILKKAKVDPLDNFSPLDPTILTNDEYNTLSVEEKTRIAAEKHNQRLVRALPFIRDHISKAVASFFLKENLITATQHEQFIANYNKKAANSAAKPTTPTPSTPSTPAVSQPPADTVDTPMQPITIEETEDEL